MNDLPDILALARSCFAPRKSAVHDKVAKVRANLPIPDFSDPAWEQADRNILALKNSGALHRAEVHRAHCEEIKWRTE